MKRVLILFRRLKNSNLIRNIELPHRSVLILAAICVSAVAITLTYKIKEARMITQAESQAIYTNNIAAVAGSNDLALAADQRVAAALAETQNVLLGGLATSSNPFDPSPKDSISDRFTKDIISAYSKSQYSQNTALGSNAGASSNIDESTVGADALNNIDTSKLPHERYTLNNISVFIPQNKADIKTYAETFAKVYLQTIAPVGKNPNAYNSNITAVGGLYKQISSNLLKLKVPNDLALIHLKIVNSFALMADTFPLIDGEEKDPVKALLGLSLVQKSLTELPTLFIQINKYFKQNGILFEKNTVGAMWLQVPDTLPKSTTPSTDQSSQIDMSQ